jgi:PAS domain S-box-containing protein
MHPEEIPRVTEKWLASMAAGEVFEDEMRLRRADGEYRWFLVRTAPLRDEQGNVAKWYGTSTDIEDRKRAEMAARALIDAIPQQIWSGPPDGTTDYCNDRWRSYTGLELEDVQGYGWQTMVHPEDRERVLRAWHEAVANGTPFEQEERHRGRDGTYRWFLSLGVPLRDADGRIVRWYGTNTDIEDRKHFEVALNAQALRYKTLMETSTDSIYVLDDKGNLQEANPAFLRRRGYTAAEGKGLNVADWDAQWNREQLRERRRKLAGKSAVFETRHRCKDGSVFDVEVCATSVQIAGQQLLFCVTRDITDRKRAAEELEEANHQLRVLSRQLFHLQEEERRHLARELHDEIGQNLTAAKINLEIIAPDVPAKVAGRLEDSVQLLDRLLVQVRHLSLELRPALLDELGLVPTLRWLVEQQAQRAGLRTEFYAPEPFEKLSAEIQTAGFRIAQEAITNVLRHAKAQMVGVHLEIDGGQLRMKIVDDGNGFELAEVERRAHEGRGFGLMGMRERAVLVGGRLRITSSPNQGTSIEVSLPLNSSNEDDRG